MAFKAESDDPRDSLSYKLKKLLALQARRVLCTDPYVRDPSLTPLATVLAEADCLFIAAPHRAYHDLRLSPRQVLIDVWNCVGKKPAGKSSPKARPS
jgi:UDP-N-acetyl-D-mannosaminuronic acid dehydrogenase